MMTWSLTTRSAVWGSPVTRHAVTRWQLLCVLARYHPLRCPPAPLPLLVLLLV